MTPIANSEKPLEIGRSVRKFLIPTAICVWIFATVFALWRYEFSYLLPVARPAGAATVNAAGTPLVKVPVIVTSGGPVSLIDSGHPILINFWNPECACSNYMEHHVRDLLDKYSSKNVQFVTVIADPGYGYTARQCRDKWLSRGFPQDKMPWTVDTGNDISRRLGVWAAPAAVILDSKGHVEYIGAYNVSRFCDADQTAFAQKALDDIVSGRTPKIRTLPFYGCQLTGVVKKV